MSAAPILTIVKNGETIKRQEIDGEVLLGRAPGCLIRLDDRAISRKHAVFRSTSGGVQVEKKSEFAPLTVNGAECSKAILKDGDVIAIGPYLLKLSLERQEKAKSQLESLADQAPSMMPVSAAPMQPVADPLATPGLEASSEGELGALDAPAPDPLAGDSDNLFSGDRAEEHAPGLESPFAMDSGEGAESPGPVGFASDSMSPFAENSAAQEVKADPLPFELDSSEEGDPLGAQPQDFETPVLASPDPLGLDQPQVSVPPPFEPSGPVDPDASTKVSLGSKVAVKLVFSEGSANVSEYDLSDAHEVTIGRGKECSIVLDSKKASRVHAVITREGMDFILKDLNSANGTYVNDERIDTVRLAGDDRIRIAGIEFQFKAFNTDYLRQNQDFMQLPSISKQIEMGGEPMESIPTIGSVVGFGGEAFSADPFAASGHDPLGPPIDDPLAPPSGVSVPPYPGSYADPLAAPLAPASPPPFTEDPLGMPGAVPGITGIAPGKPKTLMEKYRALPPHRKVIWAVIVIGLAFFLTEEDPPQPVQKKSGAAVAKKNPGVKTFESLTPEQKRFVQNQHALGFDHYKNKEYDKALYEIRKIFALIPDYKDSKEIEQYAMEGKRRLEAIEEEKRKREEEARLRAKVDQLMGEARQRMSRRQYDQAKELFYEILAIEPDNEQVSKWKTEIDSYEEQKRIDEQNRLVQQEINKRAWEFFEEGMGLKKEGHCHDAIEVFGKVADVGATDRKLLARARSMIVACKEYIVNRREPVLSKAKQYEQSGEYARAFEFYQRATVIDPPHKAGYEGMDRVRGILHERARVLYAEAVLAESYSDFDTARRKYKECLDVAPDDDIYNERARRKLANYFSRGIADAQPPAIPQ